MNERNIKILESSNPENRVPDNWEIKKLGEVCEILNGGTPDTTIRKFWNGKNLWITPKDMGKLETIYVDDTLRKITDEGLKNSSAKILPINSIILSSRAPIGHLAINKKPIATNQGCKGLVPKKGICTLYVYYFLSNSIELLNGLGSGATFKELSGSKLATVEIPVAPVDEQKRIVSILDEAFAAIAKAKANAEQNLKNAKELFESYLQGVFENKGDGWEEKKLGQIAKVIGGYSFKSGDFIEQGRYQVIRMGNVRPGIIRENENPVFIDKLDDEVLKRALLLFNDVIITQTGTKKKRDYGYTVIINKDNYLLNQRISAIRFSENYLPKFFLYYSWTNLFKDQYFANETGTVGQGNVGIGGITEAMIPFLPLKEQQAIVQKLDTLSAETKKLEAIYQKKTEDLEELKKVVLGKAFKGELSEHDLEGLKENRIKKNAVVV